MPWGLNMRGNRAAKWLGAALASVLLLTAALLLPGRLMSLAQTAALDTTAVLPLEAMPSEEAPAPLSFDEALDRALVWHAGENASAQFVGLEENAAPDETELTEDALLQRLQTQLDALDAGYGVPNVQNADEWGRELVYYRLFHGITGEHQGFYRVTYTAQDGKRAEFILDAVTGTLIECEYNFSCFLSKGMGYVFAELWGISESKMQAWGRMPSLGRERMTFGNGGARHIDFLLDAEGPLTAETFCRVTLRPGPGEKE